MTTSLRSFLFIGILIVVSCNQSNKHTADTTSSKQTSATNNLFFQDSGYSSITLQRDTVNGFPEVEEILRTQSYHFMMFSQYFSGSSAGRHALISELSEQHSKDAPDIPEVGKIILSAFIPNSNPIQNDSDLRANKWQDTVNANEVHYADEYIDFITNRDNQDPPYPAVHNIYSYDQGSKIMAFSSDFYGIESRIDEPKRRYIGYLDYPYDCGSFGESHPDIDGVLTYIDPISKKAQYVLITYSVSDADMEVEKQIESFDGLTISGLQKSLTSHSSNHSDSLINNEHWGYSDLKHFTISLSFTGIFNATLSIPVVNDSIDISNIHSNRFKLEVIR